MTIFLEAIQRLIEVPVITNPKLILVVGTAGLFSNILGLFLFHEHGHSHGGGGGSGHSHSHGASYDEESLLDVDEDDEQHTHGHSHGGVTESDVLGFSARNKNNERFRQALVDDSRPISEAMPSSVVSRFSEHSRLLDSDHSSENLAGPASAATLDYGSTVSTANAVEVPGSKASSSSHSHSHGDENSHSHAHSPPRPRALSLTHSNHFHAKPRGAGQKSKSLNMEGVFLHVMGDALGNVGVILTALVIWKTDYSWKYYLDPIISLVITAIIFSSAMPLCRRTSAILLQGVPQTVDADEVKEDIVSLPGVLDIHELHIWILREDLNVATLHVSVSITPQEFMKLAQRIRTCMRGHGIASTTIQPEFVTKSKTNSICSHSLSGDVSTGGLHAVSSALNLGEIAAAAAAAGEAVSDVAGSSDEHADGTTTPTCVLQGNLTTGGLQANNGASH